ncbi:MAG: hypothetical protein KDD69_19845 [Bdellovibrionales bacterium]|nr:hypothetical protein [Bdellovibrionales bacterium]
MSEEIEDFAPQDSDIYMLMAAISAGRVLGDPYHVTAIQIVSGRTRLVVSFERDEFVTRDYQHGKVWRGVLPDYAADLREHHLRVNHASNGVATQ